MMSTMEKRKRTREKKRFENSSESAIIARDGGNDWVVYKGGLKKSGNQIFNAQAHPAFGPKSAYANGR
jgi:hypothetical protein